MTITALTKIELCEEDFRLLDRIAKAAGKSRDVFVSDIMFEVLTMERMILEGTGHRDGVGNNGANTNHKA